MQYNPNKTAIYQNLISGIYLFNSSITNIGAFYEIISGIPNLELVQRQKYRENMSDLLSNRILTNYTISEHKIILFCSIFFGVLLVYDNRSYMRYKLNLTAL